MSEKPRQPVLHLITCAAEPMCDVEPFVKTCRELGWDVYIVATSSALKHLDTAALAEMTGHAVHGDGHSEPACPMAPAGAIAVAPASFNTINKWAYGNNDNLALRLLNEATGLGLPIVALPAPEPALARHPAFVESLARLRRWGVTVVFDPARYPPPDATPYEEIADPVPWRVAEHVIAEWTRFARLPAPGARPTGPAPPSSPPPRVPPAPAPATTRRAGARARGRASRSSAQAT